MLTAAYKTPESNFGTSFGGVGRVGTGGAIEGAGRPGGTGGAGGGT